ncbi:MAG: hypothetical protein Q8L66_11280 [Caulobacter sp.]|nr:hypothetical protein [Caulobacter sp.]
MKMDPIADLRAAISEAEISGTDRKKLVLQLTHRDASLFKRSPAVALDEISFKDGEMRFLGIRVEVGAVAVSALTAP